MQKAFSWLTGNSPKSAYVQEAEQKFDREEIRRLKESFYTLGRKKNVLNENELKELLGLGERYLDTFVKILEKIVAKESPQEGVTYGDYLHAKAKARAGDSVVQDYFYQGLATEGIVLRDDFASAVQGALSFLIGAELEHNDLVERIVDGRLGRDKALAQKNWNDFCKQVPLVVPCVRCVLGEVARGDLRVPALELGGAGDSFLRAPNCHMSASHAALLSCGMTSRQRGSWELLFHSDKHGKSFNTFMSRVSGRGSTVVIVSDRAGNVFGGFAGHPWAKAGTFTGDFSCFVFSLRPKAAVYRPSGVNENFQWCGQGFNSLPNGFGFGGQTGYFAVYVDDTLEKGMTRAAATYNNPAFAEEQLFEVETVECWLVEPSEEEHAAREKAGTVMDRYGQTSKFLSIAGAGSDHSAAYRHGRPEDEEDSGSRFR